MFLIIPAIIIFLAFSYLHLNEDVSTVTEIIIYVFITSVVVLSFYTYSSIKKNLKQQELNKILLEIHNLQIKLKNTTSENQKDTLQLQITRLQKELNEHKS